MSATPKPYNDVAPVQLLHGELFDRHNDRLAIFDPSVEDAVRAHIVHAVNTLDEARAALEGAHNLAHAVIKTYGSEVTAPLYEMALRHSKQIEAVLATMKRKDHVGS